ncbi:MAG: T9SS type A sorting domain-containing protein, partial [Candidatus Coatesbacteria bacterium]|nr:T9SS type A sorting domain-containing protein [Candidatus Coatesbacteria bacterium]
IWSVPFVFNHVVYFGSGDSYLYAIETYGYKGFKENKSINRIPGKHFSVYPNPFTSHLSISSSSSASIYSLTGQLIVKLDKGKHSLDTNSWKEGVYIIKSEKETKRIVKINE